MTARLTTLAVLAAVVLVLASVAPAVLADAFGQLAAMGNTQ